jgi:hypothetical protein
MDASDNLHSQGANSLGNNIRYPLEGAWEDPNGVWTYREEKYVLPLSRDTDSASLAPIRRRYEFILRHVALKLKQWNQGRRPSLGKSSANTFPRQRIRTQQ